MCFDTYQQNDLNVVLTVHRCRRHCNRSNSSSRFQFNFMSIVTNELSNQYSLSSHFCLMISTAFKKFLYWSEFFFYIYWFKVWRYKRRITPKKTKLLIAKKSRKIIWVRAELFGFEAKFCCKKLIIISSSRRWRKKQRIFEIAECMYCSCNRIWKF